MIGLIAAAALTIASGCTGSLCGASNLAPFYAKLQAAKGRTGKPVHILQIGDSHSAGDSITGAWRDTLQGRYGSGGRGLMPPGRPYDGYLTYGVTVSMTGSWRVASDFGKASAEPKPPLGISAFSLTSQAPGAGMAIEAEPQQRFTRFVVCALMRPGAGSLMLHLGDQEQRWELSSLIDRPECRTFESETPVTHADLTTEGGPVTLTSWGTFADQGGVTVSNVGVVGSQLVHFGRTSDTVLQEEFATYKPDLIVIEFGTNEGFDGRFNSFEYEIVLRSQISRFRRLAGNVPILLIGAPDALTRRPELKTNATGADVSSCEGAAMAASAPVPPVAPAQGGLMGAMERIGDFLGVTSASETGQTAGVPAAAGAVTSAAAPAGKIGLFPPAGLTGVREVQKRIAAQLHVAFWDWGARMGGRCTALGWVRQATPYMRSDYVHFTKAGGKEVAGRLQADLDNAVIAR